jgi:hypothetical protein
MIGNASCFNRPPLGLVVADEPRRENLGMESLPKLMTGPPRSFQALAASRGHVSAHSLRYQRANPSLLHIFTGWAWRIH